MLWPRAGRKNYPNPTLGDDPWPCKKCMHWNLVFWKHTTQWKIVKQTDRWHLVGAKEFRPLHSTLGSCIDHPLDNLYIPRSIDLIGHATKMHHLGRRWTWQGSPLCARKVGAWRRSPHASRIANDLTFPNAEMSIHCTREINFHKHGPLLPQHLV
jgi:hypothetical protein